MTAYLRIWPPASRQFRSGRRAKPTGCMVIHTAETTPGFKPPDRAAENVANFIRKRQDPGSYHTIVDSDSSIQLVEFRDEAFHDGTGSNPWSIGLSVATFAASWKTAPKHWVDGAVQRLAEAAADANEWLIANGHPACPARRITRQQSNAGMAGFISHAERDPGRRSDPGSDFPWAEFLAAYDALINPTQEPDDLMATPHLEVPAAVKAIADMYKWYATKRPADKRYPESPEALEYQLNRYFSTDDPAAFLVQLGKELRDE